MMFAKLALCLSLALVPLSVRAATINVGTFSYDVFIPGGVTPGINGFTITNFTETYALAPDFPVLTPMTLSGTVVTLFFESGAVSNVPLGNLGPGIYTPAALQFPETETFLSATLTADLEPISITVDGGSVLTLLNPHIQVSLTPSAGNTLGAGIDLLVYSVDAEAETSSGVPEPGSAWTVSIALLLTAYYIFKRRKRTHETAPITTCSRSSMDRP